MRKRKQRFNIGDVVRISLKKSTFHRSYNLQRSYERFFVSSVNLKMKIQRYTLKDENGDEISGDFLGYEMIKVDLERYRAVIVKLPIPGEAKAKAMPGRLYIHTRNNNNNKNKNNKTTFVSYLNSPRKG